MNIYYHTSNNDSGSPIIIPGRTPQQDRLVAMVSWGTECADPDFPGTLVLFFLLHFAEHWFPWSLCLSWFVSLITPLIIYSYHTPPAVNSRISSSYDWIQATTCSLSNYPPVYLCGGGGSIDTAENFVLQHERRWWWYLCAILPGLVYYYYCHQKRRLSEWPKQRLLPKSTKSEESDFCDFLTSSSSSTHLGGGVGKKSYSALADVDPSFIRTTANDADGGGGGGGNA
jgi:hypothetical protein